MTFHLQSWHKLSEGGRCLSVACTDRNWECWRNWNCKLGALFLLYVFLSSLDERHSREQPAAGWLMGWAIYRPFTPRMSVSLWSYSGTYWLRWHRAAAKQILIPVTVLADIEKRSCKHVVFLCAVWSLSFIKAVFSPLCDLLFTYSEQYNAFLLCLEWNLVVGFNSVVRSWRY